MGARSGNNYLSALRKLKAEVWIGGERVADVTQHPALMRCARSIASLYDMQMEHPGAMTSRTPDGDRIGYSFVQPASADEVRKRSLMMRNWAEFSGGMLGRTPDYLNASIAAMAAARDFFAESDSRFGDNIARYYQNARRHDWCATHTLVNPRASHAAGWAGQTDADLALRLVDRTGDGIVVSGCRMLATLGPLAEQLLVFPSTVLQAEPAAEPFALAFAVACNAPGLEFLCRDPFDIGRSRFDHPLAARFDEMDCVVLLRPCDGAVGERLPVRRRESMQRDVRSHQRRRPHDASGGRQERGQERVPARVGGENRRGQRRQSLPHVRERLAEIIMTTETMRACLRAAEADAARDNWGTFVPACAPLDTARNLFPRLYPRMVEIIQLNSSSSLMATPSERDFESPLAPAIGKYLGAANAAPRDRVALYRLAWDVACSAFGGRQVLYERFFFGDPIRMASALVDATDLKPLIAKVNAFLARKD